MASKFVRSLRAFAVVATVATVFSACLQPTQIKLEILTDIPCNLKPSTAIIVGNSDAEAETAAPGTVTEMCHADGRIGAIVLLPRSEKDEAISIRIVMGVGLGFDAEECLANPNQRVGNEAGCIVARRSLRFIPSTPLYLPVNMRGDCLGVPCLPGQTCSLSNKCESAEVPNLDSCAEGEEGCSADITGAGGAGGASSSSSSNSSSNSSSSSSSSSGQAGAGGASSSSSSSNSSSSGQAGAGGASSSSSSSNSSSSGQAGSGGASSSSNSSSSSTGAAGTGGTGGTGGMDGMGGFGGGVVVVTGGNGGAPIGSGTGTTSGMGGMGGMGGAVAAGSGTGGIGGAVIIDGAGGALMGTSGGFRQDYDNDDSLIPPGVLIPGQQYVVVRPRRSMKPRKTPPSAIPALRLPLYTYPRNVKP